MFETIYSLNLAPQGDGTYVKSPPMAGGAQSWADLCHVLINTKEFIFVN